MLRNQQVLSSNLSVGSSFLFVLALTVPVAADEWVHVRAPDLAGRQVIVAGRRTPATKLLAGADPAKDGLWVQVPDGTRRSDVTFAPPLAGEPHVHVVRVPPGLDDTWRVVPFSPSAYGLDDISQAQSLGVSTSGSGYKASLRPRQETPAVACAPVPRAAKAALPLRIADFEDGPLQSLGNRFGLFSGRGGEIRTRRIRDEHGGRIALSTKMADARSFAGLWIELGALRGEADAVDLPGLRAVLVRGHGRPRGTVKLSDVAAAAADASVVLGALDGAADGDWARTFPVDATKLDLHRLRSLVIDLSAGAGELQVDEIVLLGDGEAPAPYRSASSTRAGAGARATWAWHTRELMDDAAARAALVETTRRWRLGEVYLQLPHDGDLASISDVSRLAELVAELHRAGLKVHALDGAPWLALADARPVLVGLAQSVASYNARQPPASRFDALHLDVEPYLLPPFGGRRRGELLDGFRESLRAVRTAIGPLPLWIDVPFWFDGADEGTTVETGPRAGCAKPAFLREALSVADGIVVMSYRTRADAADGLAAVALGELALGRELHKPVRIGVETIQLGPERGWRVDLGARPKPVVGQPAVALVDDGYLFFTPSLAAGEAARLDKGIEMLRAEYSESAPPAKITFHGRTRDDVEATVGEALELARRSGTPADGVAFHEARTLPQ